MIRNRTIFLALGTLLALSTPIRAQQPIYYDGIYGDELVSVLAEVFRPIQVLPLTQSVDTLYAIVDRVSVNGEDGIEGLYSGLFVPFDCTPACDPSLDIYNDGEGLTHGYVWPLSRGTDFEVAERDMHHMFAARADVIGARGDLPFGESPDEQTTAWYRSTVTSSTPPPEAERDAWSELLGDTLFEPRESKKGDVARAAFYFYTVYGPAGLGQTDSAFFDAMKETLLAWHEADPATADDIARSERVATYQSTGYNEAPAINPFVHDSTLVRRAFFPETVYGPTVFVDINSPEGGSGTSWSEAFSTIQEAAAYAAFYPGLVREIWVAEGTYRPTNDDPNSDDPREAFFRLRSGLSLYGGFAGMETSVDGRDWEARPTILSGDIGVEGDPSDNAYTVVRAHLVDSTTVLDGFTITGGRADGDEVDGSGGGLYITSSDLVLRNLRVVGNTASGVGGGGFISGNAPYMSGLTFEANTAGERGGGLYVYPGSYGEGDVVLTDAAFVGNTALHGGGLYWEGGSNEIGGVIERVRFEGNAADPESGRGGGMNAGNSYGSIRASDLTFVENTAFMGGGYGDYGSSGLVMAGATFTGNEAVYGGGFANGGTGGRPTLRDIHFVENTAEEAGGGLFCGQVPGSDWSGGALVVGAEFIRNTAAEGGGLACRGSFTQNFVYNASFLGNTAERGGALSFVGTAESVFVNAVIAGNTASEGSVLYSDDGRTRFAQLTAVGNASSVRLLTRGNFTAENSILWGNGPAIVHEDYLSIWAWDNIIEGGCPAPPGDIHCANARSVNPLVARTPSPGLDGVWGTDDDDYGELRLQPGSPAVNFGSNSRLPPDIGDLDGDGDILEAIPYDRGGDPRVLGGNPDLGAFEGGYLVDVEPATGTPGVERLAPAYPNPFAARVTVPYALRVGADVKLVVYDVLGREVAVLVDSRAEAGYHQAVFDGASLPSGTYLVRMTTDEGFTQTQRLTLLR